MEALVGGLYVFLLIGAFLAWQYLKGLPDRLHEEGVTRLEYDLEESLEQLRASLREDIEMAKIAAGELQVRKTEEFIDLSSFFHEIITNPEMADRVERDQEAKQELQKRLLNSAVKLFFFSSDETIERYKEWWHTSLRAEQDDDVDNVEVLKRYAELNVAMRRDLGYSDTDCTAEYFLAVVFTDWEEIQEELEVRE